MKTAVYARVSTDTQAERQTIDAQLHRCREYAAQKGWEVVEEFRDEGVSGAVAFEERPEGHRLLKAADDKRFDRVLVLCVDRLSRSVMDAAVTQASLMKRAPLEFVLQTFDTDEKGRPTPEGELMFNQFAAFAQYERRVIGRRTNEGKKRQARNGTYMCSIAPYGYRRENGHLEVNAQEAEVVRNIFRWAGEGDGLWVISNRLNEEGVPTPNNASHEVHRSHWGWHRSTVYKVLTARRYVGEGSYGGVTMTCPPLVDAETFERAAAGFKARKRNGPARTKRFYLLRKLLYCRRCGGTYTPKVGRRDQVSWVCVKRLQYGARAGHENMKWQHRAEDLEERVKRHVADLLTDPRRALADAEFYAEAVGVALGEQAQRADSLLTRLEELDAEEARVLALARKGVIDDAQTTRQLALVRKEREKAKAELDALSAYPERDLQREADDYMLWLADTAERGTVNLDGEALRETVQQVVQRVWVEDDGGLTVEGLLDDNVFNLSTPSRKSGQTNNTPLRYRQTLKAA